MNQERYEVLSRVGEGGQGAVYLGYDRQLKREVAIKRLSHGETGDDDGARLQKEASLLASLRHPNIVTIFDVAQDDEGLFMVMERLQGSTLHELSRREPRPDAAIFGQVASGVLEALVAAHAEGILHRDIKPENIHISTGISGRLHAKLLDFGLAKASTAALKQTLDGKGNVMGTVHYMAPEQFLRRPLDARTDLYMLGASLYEFLAGVRAFEAETVAGIMDRHLKHDVKPLDELRADLPPALCQWVMWLLGGVPVDRPASAAVALASLKRVLDGGSLEKVAPVAVTVAEPVPVPAARPQRSPGTAASPTMRPTATAPRSHAAGAPAATPLKKNLPWPIIVTGSLVLLGVGFLVFPRTSRARDDMGLLPVTQGLVLHLDASTTGSVRTDGSGRVAQWHGTSGTALHAAPVKPENAPTLKPGVLGGRPVVDSGPAGSDQWLEIRNAEATMERLANIRTVFWVMRGSGFLLGDDKGHEFHRGYPETVPTGKIWAAKYAASGIQKGVLRVNGEIVDGFTTALPEDFSLITLVTTSSVKACRLSRDRDLTARSGGQQIAELVIYDRPLTDAEVLAVEAHFMRKWFGR